MKAKKWNAGIADEEWKMKIVRRDLEELDNLVLKLDSILMTYVPGISTVDRLKNLRTLNEGEIVNGLLRYRESLIKSTSK